MRKVYIVNHSNHDFSDAERFGKIIFMTGGRMNRYSTNDMARQFSEALEDSSPDDYIVLCSLNVMNAIATAIFSHKHGTLNLLLFKEGKYIERRHIL